MVTTYALPSHTVVKPTIFDERVQLDDLHFMRNQQPCIGIFLALLAMQLFIVENEIASSLCRQFFHARIDGADQLVLATSVLIKDLQLQGTSVVPIAKLLHRQLKHFPIRVQIVVDRLGLVHRDPGRIVFAESLDDKVRIALTEHAVHIRETRSGEPQAHCFRRVLRFFCLHEKRSSVGALAFPARQQERPTLSRSTHQLAQRERGTANVVMLREFLRGRVLVVDVDFQLLLQFKVVVHKEQLGPRRTQIVFQRFGAADFDPMLPLEHKQHREWIRFGDDVAVLEVLGAERELDARRWRRNARRAVGGVHAISFLLPSSSFFFCAQLWTERSSSESDS